MTNESSASRPVGINDECEKQDEEHDLVDEISRGLADGLLKALRVADDAGHQLAGGVAREESRRLLKQLLIEFSRRNSATIPCPV